MAVIAKPSRISRSLISTQGPYSPIQEYITPIGLMTLSDKLLSPSNVALRLPGVICGLEMHPWCHCTCDLVTIKRW